MANTQTAVAAEYESLCEELFREWLAGAISRQNLDSAFSTDHCPEPYLDFTPGHNPLIYVTHNPGRGELFQLRSSLDTPASPLVSHAPYRDNARRLALWYSGAGSLKISAAARTRISGMNDLAAQLGASGVRQVETFPLHSNRGTAKQFLTSTMQLTGCLSEYRNCCKRYIASRPVVLALSGSAPDRRGEAVNIWADAIGLDLDRARFLPLKHAGGRHTVGIFASSSTVGLRALFCCQGSNSLPGRERMPTVVEFLSH